MRYVESAMKMTITMQLCQLSLAKEATLTFQENATRGFSAASYAVLVHRGLEA